MKRTASVLALSLCMAVSAFAPAFAGDDSGLDMAVQGALFPVRLLAVGAGVVVGTPIAVLRETTKSYVHYTSGAADKVGGHDNAGSCVLANFFSAPVSLVVGSGKGVYAGTKNGIVKGFNEPFNKDSFSVGSLEE